MEEIEMFWTVFGAVGTTLGTLITAIAVIVAIIQYRQPIKKGLKIRFAMGFTALDNGRAGDDLYFISVSNTCVRNIIVSGIYFNIRNKDIVDLYGRWQLEVEAITFPMSISPEENIEYRLYCRRVNEGISYSIGKKEFGLKDKVRVHVRDSCGKDYYKKLKWRTEDFLK